MSEKREQNFRRNEVLEGLLSQLNADMQPSEQDLIAQYRNRKMDFPLILVMGPLRSGTTLFTQWLANSNLIAYPTNLLSRFYKAPILGAKIQLLLTDQRFNFRNELGEFVQQTEYKSDNGKTQGALAPNEFWYFWRRFLSEPNRDIWSDEQLQQSMDATTMKAELNGMMDVFQKPFAAKGMLFNYNIPFLNAIFDKVLFVQMQRDPVANVASILEARTHQLGNENEWYSFKIPEYEQLKDMKPVTQAAGQLYFINKAVTQGMTKIDESRKLVVKYEDFCKNPTQYYELLLDKLYMNELASYSGPQMFSISKNSIDTDSIKSAIKHFEINAE